MLPIDDKFNEKHPLYIISTGPKIDRLQSMGVPSQKNWEELGERKPALNGFAADRWVHELYEAVKPLFRRVDFKAVDAEEMAMMFASKFAHQVINCDEGLASWQGVTLKAREFLHHLGLPFPNGRSLKTQLARLENPIWWRRQLSVMVPRIVDQTTRKLGYVSKHNEIYLSDAAFKMYQGRVQSARLMLDEYQAVNDAGQVYSLSELVDLSVSNPVHRRIEMMVRCRGLDERAEQLGRKASFITLTAPSKYHRHAGSGHQNKRWNRSDPREANRYLTNLWARVRSRLADYGIQYYGVRVVEPHHDGCPHWHLLIYADDIKAVEETAQRYALEEDGDEPGARQHRCTCERIDPARGTGAGYIAKYISKSIDGYRLDEDMHGQPATDSAARVTAWSRIWGIRQFQFFGAGTVGIYRELRRVRNRRVDDPYSVIWQSADSASYCGVMQSMSDRIFRLHREPWVDEETGECDSPYNAYGELKALPIRGVICDRDEGESYPPLYTRLSEWSISRILREEPQRDADSGAPWTCVNNCTLVVPPSINPGPGMLAHGPPPN